MPPIVEAGRPDGRPSWPRCRRPASSGANSAATSRSPLLRLARAHSRPPVGELERPVVAELVDRDLPDLGAAEEVTAVVGTLAVAGDQDLGGAEIHLDLVDARRVLGGVDGKAGRSCPAPCAPPATPRQGDAALPPVMSTPTVRISPWPFASICSRPDSATSTPRSSTRSGDMIGKHPRLEAVDPRFDGDAAAVARVDAGQRGIDRIAMPREPGGRLDRHAGGIALPAPHSPTARPRSDPTSDRASVTLACVTFTESRLAHQRIVVGLRQQAGRSGWRRPRPARHLPAT